MPGVGYATIKQTFRIMKEKGSYCRPVEISDKLGVSGQVAFFSLKELVVRGVAKKVGRGKYQLEDDMKTEEDFFPKVSMSGIKYPIEIWSYHKFLAQLLKQSRQRYTSQAKLKKYVCKNNLTIEFLVDLWEKQSGRCLLTGIPMTTVRGNGWQIPTNVSIDQIKHRYGYTKENVRLLCWQANMMRGQLTDEELIIFCRLIFKNKSDRDAGV